MIAVIKSVAGILGFLLNEGRGRSFATKSIEKSALYWLFAFFISAMIGFVFAERGTTCSRVQYSPAYMWWWLFGFGVMLQSFFTAYKSRKDRIDKHKAEELARYYLDKIIDGGGNTTINEVPAMAMYEIEAPLDMLESEARYIDWSHSVKKLGTAFDWMGWLNDPKLKPVSQGHIQKLQKIADSMEGDAWKDVSLRLLNLKKTTH